MPHDEGLGGVPDTLAPLYVHVGGVPGIVQGASAEQPQYGRARQSVALGLFAGATRGTRNAAPARRLDADMRDHVPQSFPTRPNIIQALPGAVGRETGLPHLPGRVPPAGWSGEAGPESPFAEV